MTLAAACGWSLVRSLVVALAAWPICNRQSAWLRGMDHWRRRRAWFVLLIPFLCPELWTGYAWSGFALRLAGTAFWNLFPSGFFPSPQAIVARDAAVDELLLHLLLFFRAVPVGTLAVYFAPPPPLSEEAVYCRELVRAKSQRRGSPFGGGIGFMLRGRWHTALPAVALMFLVSFQEFELASLIGRPAWTVWLFDAQVGGLALRESLRLALLPVVCQMVVLLPVAWWVLASRSVPSRRVRHSRPISLRWQRAMWVLVFVAVTVTVVVPAVLVGQGMPQGLGHVFQNRAQLELLLKEITVGIEYALAAAVASAFVASRLMLGARRSRLARAGVLAC